MILFDFQVIGSSILILYDRSHKAGAWMIDFGKTLPVDTPRSLTHRTPWEVGNHEDGYLHGLDNLIGVSIQTNNGIYSLTWTWLIQITKHAGVLDLLKDGPEKY